MAEMIFRKLKRNNQNTHRVVFRKGALPWWALVSLNFWALLGLQWSNMGWAEAVTCRTAYPCLVLLFEEWPRHKRQDSLPSH